MEKNKEKIKKGQTKCASMGMSNSRTQDSAAKLIFGNNKLCSQFLRDYSGIELLKDVSEDDIEDMTTKYLPMFTEERDSDVVKRVKLHSGDYAFIIALIEHKSTVDYNVSMQLLRYMVYIWEDYEKEQNKIHKGISKTKEFKYPPILPIVYYEGRSEWNAVMDFRDRVFLDEVFREFIPGFNYKLIRLREYTNKELIDRKDEISFVMLIDRLKDSNEFRYLKDELPDGYLDEISEMSADDVLSIISKVVAAMLRRRKVSEDKISEFTEEIKERPMGILFEDWDNGPDDALIEKGRQEERKNTLLEKERADKAEAEVKRLREEIERLKALIK